jgi:Tfp pilus assembly protein PilN
MNSINLIGHNDHVSVPIASRKLKLMRAIAVLLLFGISAASIILYILIAFSPLPQVQEQERQARAVLANAHPDMTRIALLEDRITGVAAILQERHSYDKVLDSINSKMPSGITVFQINIAKKTVTLTVRSDSLDVLTTFVSNLTASVDTNEFAKVTLNSIVSDDASGTFSLTVSIGLL